MCIYIYICIYIYSMYVYMYIDISNPTHKIPAVRLLRYPDKRHSVDQWLLHLRSPSRCRQTTPAAPFIPRRTTLLVASNMGLYGVL